MEELDLHGLSIIAADLAVENFILKYWNAFPVRIITGYSTKMKENTIKLLTDYECKWEIPAHNGGEIIVLDHS